jgi:hypothetical protein
MHLDCSDAFFLIFYENLISRTFTNDLGFIDFGP